MRRRTGRGFGTWRCSRRLTKVPGPLATKSLFVLALQCPQVEISGGQFLALLNPFPSFCVANGAKDKDLMAIFGREQKNEYDFRIHHLLLLKFINFSFIRTFVTFESCSKQLDTDIADY